MVPGLGLDARSWSGVLPYLTTASTVLTLPGMGQPARRDADLTAPGLARRLGRLLPPHGGLVLVGHSASCQVVVELALRDTRVRGLVLVGPTTDPAAATWPRMVTQWLRTARHEQLWEAAVLAPQYRRTGPASMLHCMERVRRHRIDLALASVAAQVVIVRGEHDHIAPARWCDELASLSGGSVTTSVDAGHMVPLTHPRVVGESINEVLTGPGPAAGPRRR